MSHPDANAAFLHEYLLGYVHLGPYCVDRDDGLLDVQLLKYARDGLYLVVLVRQRFLRHQQVVLADEGVHQIVPGG